MTSVTRVYAYSEGHDPHLIVLTDSALCERFERYLDEDKLVCYDFVDVGSCSHNDHQAILETVQDSGY